MTKKKTAAPTKKAAKKAAAKVATVTSFDPDAKIKLVSKDNPYRGKRAAMFKLLADGATVEQIREKQAKKSDLAHKSLSFILTDAAAKGLIRIAS